MSCELFDDCGYIKKLGIADRIFCAGVISVYCKGEEMEKCERRKFYQKYGKYPPDNFSPEGNIQVY